MFRSTGTSNLPARFLVDSANVCVQKQSSGQTVHEPCMKLNNKGQIEGSSMT